jgi:ketosteroid isomerase-like protein
MNHSADGGSFHEANTVLLRFYRSMDRKDTDAACACFAEDAVWMRRGVTLKGRSEIRAAISGRPQTAETAHLVTNFLVEADESEACVCSYYLTAYLMTDPANGQVEQPQLPFQLAYMRVHMRPSGDGLTIDHMATTEQKFMR